MPLALLVAASCENDPKYFDDAPSLWLSGDGLYSFMFYDYSVVSHELSLVAHVAGHATSSDRTFKLEVVDEFTNVSPSDYTVGDLIVPKGELRGVIPVTVKRAVSGIDITDATTGGAQLTFRVVENENFKVGAEELKIFTLRWCDYLVQPDSWGNISWYIGPFSQARYKFIIDFTGLTSFEEFDGNLNMVFWLQATCVKLLNEYNADPANEGRTEGWPYLNDNGEPLQIGEGLSV